MMNAQIEVAGQQVALTYSLLTLTARTIGRETAARYALDQPGMRGVVLFCAARGDSAAEAASLLKVEVRELERAIRRRDTT